MPRQRMARHPSASAGASGLATRRQTRLVSFSLQHGLYHEWASRACGGAGSRLPSLTRRVSRPFREEFGFSELAVGASEFIACRLVVNEELRAERQGGRVLQRADRKGVVQGTREMRAD